MKFTLKGNKGLGINGSGFPTTQQVSCTDGSPLGASEPASVGPLTYTAKTELYQLNWQRSSAWAGTCRQFVVGLNDGTQHALAVRFP